jgi:hypothetical protein
VEKFELIATTGKNAKMPIIPLYNQLIFPAFTTALRPWLRIEYVIN